MSRRLQLLLAAYVVLLLVAAGIFDLAEHRGYADSLWLAIVTATTVGYGDLSPATAVGRAMAVILVHLTTLGMLPLLTAEIAAKLIVDNDAFTHAEQEGIKASLERIERRLEQLGS